MRRSVHVLLAAAVALAAIAAVDPIALITDALHDARAHAHKIAYAPSAEIPTTTISDQPCVDGRSAEEFACDGVDLLSFIPSAELGAHLAGTDPSGLLSGNSDVWGWTDPENGDEYVMMGHTNGTAFVRVTDPLAPVYLGSVPNTAAAQLIWHDIKVVNDHAVIVSESAPHGMQVVDLSILRDLDGSTSDVPLPITGFYPLSVSQHNVVVNDEADHAYIVGGNVGIVVPDECSAGLNILDMSNPAVPVKAGCWTGDAYVHDAHCLRYEGENLPDPEHAGKDICATFAEDQMSIVDVTDPAAPQLLGTARYNHAYTHQGWFTEDLRYVLMNDELDEGRIVAHTRTLLVDTSDLDNPRVVEQFLRDGSDGNPATVSIDHNNYVHQGLAYQSNYTSGLRVIDVRDLDVDPETNERSWDEVAFFDTYPADDDAPVTSFEGTWSNYPFFASGTIAVSGIGEGLFLLRLQEGVSPAQ